MLARRFHPPRPSSQPPTGSYASPSSTGSEAESIPSSASLTGTTSEASSSSDPPGDPPTGTSEPPIAIATNSAPGQASTPSESDSQPPAVFTSITSTFGPGPLTNSSLTPSSPSSSPSPPPTLPFTPPSPLATTSTTNTLSPSQRTLAAGAIAGIVIGVLFIVAIALLAAFLFMRHRRRSRMPPSKEFMIAQAAGMQKGGATFDFVSSDGRSAEATPIMRGFPNFETSKFPYG
ncbi:hypothetical protein CCMSSC00406_0008736 [Pleurotus cornucopiae]|uniref:Uncharacterized protein n=1 Tax=Pleurotus cornucopiae TaxID=5321 RepID=A0ACB7J8E7_PLECO|nr:hypothetical protein CCMSSC00406_0008736 [Pleurotus cornucopiae]